MKLEMNLELTKSSKWPARWQELARALSPVCGSWKAAAGQVCPRQVSAEEWKTAWLAQILVAALFLIDYCTGIRFHFGILYFIPITYAARAGGVSAGLITSGTSGAAWFLAELLGGGDLGTGWVPYYKNLTRLLGFATIAFLLARGKELTEQLTEKARGLSQEIERRKRTEKIYADEKEILEKVACEQPLPDILDALAKKIEQWHPGMVCAVLLFDPERNRFRCAIGPNFPTELQMAFQKKPAEQGVSTPSDGGRLEHDLMKSAEWSPFRQMAAQFGLEPQCSKAVLSASGELVGILCLFSAGRKAEAALDVALFEKARDIASIAIERARLSQELRLLSELIIEAQEAERRRIARELHDSVNQMLSSVIFRFGMIESQILSTNRELQEELARAKGLLTRGLDEIHRISDALRPSELDALGLVPSIRSLCQEFQAKTRLELKFESKVGVRRLDNGVELTLYRIIQEALNNIEKHSAATRAAVRLQWDGAGIHLQISDNGKGLESTALRLKSAKKTGMGLLNMRERTAYLGGVFSIQSKEGAGTEICVRLPLVANENKEATTT